MHYSGSVYRPPSEAYSLIVQVTLGCSHNKCAFCNMYKDKQFSIVDIEQVMEDLAWARERYSRIERIFLADGDAPGVLLRLLAQHLRQGQPGKRIDFGILAHGHPLAHDSQRLRRL